MTDEQRCAEVYASMIGLPRCEACFILIDIDAVNVLCHACLVKWDKAIDTADDFVTGHMYLEYWYEWIQQQQSLRS